MNHTKNLIDIVALFARIVAFFLLVAKWKMTFSCVVVLVAWQILSWLICVNTKVNNQFIISFADSSSIESVQAVEHFDSHSGVMAFQCILFCLVLFLF